MEKPMAVERGDSSAIVGGTSSDTPSTFEQTTLKGTTSSGNARLIVRDATQIDVIDTASKFLTNTVESVLAELDDRVLLVENEGVTVWGNLLGTLSDQTDLQTELDTLNASILAHSSDVTTNPHAVTKTQVGLGNADNTSDIDKPVSTAQATADSLRLLLTGGTLTGHVSGIAPTADAHLTRKDYVDQVAKSKNALINGNFDIWQRGTSQTGYGYGYGSDDRWLNVASGSTSVHSQQAFALGQTDVPNNPKYYSRTVVTSVAGAGNYVLKSQRIEDVSSFSGETVTLSFWAKADATKNIATGFVQYMGSGGTPSAHVTNIGVTTHALTTSWTKFTATVAIPSVSGKTVGTNGDHSLHFEFWFDAGSTFDGRTNSLGQQSGTFDIAQVQIEKGSTATEFERRHYADELALCERYYQRIHALMFSGNVTSGGYYYVSTQLRTEMRTAPSATVTNGGQSCFPTTPSLWILNSYMYGATRVANATGVGYFFEYVRLDAEL